MGALVGVLVKLIHKTNGATIKIVNAQQAIHIKSYKHTKIKLLTL